MTKPLTEAHLTGAVQEIISHFNKSQSTQNERLDGIARHVTQVKLDLENVKLDVAKVKLAVLDYLATDRAVHNLVRELKAQGITLDEKKIFAV